MPEMPARMRFYMKGMTMTTRERVLAEARALLGVRFMHQGRMAEHGLDCLGLLLVVAMLSGRCQYANG